MTLVDTSVWVEHLRRGSVALAGELEAGQVLASAMLAAPARLWPSDQRLAAIASELNVVYESARR